MWDFNICLVILSRRAPTAAHALAGFDCSGLPTPAEKASALATETVGSVSQAEQLKNPDARVALGKRESTSLLSKFALDSSGCLTGDGERFYRTFWQQELSEDWEFLQSTVNETIFYGGRSLVIFWQRASGELFHFAEEMKGTNHAVQNWRRGQDVWGMKGVAVSSMGLLAAAIYDGCHFDNNTAVLIPRDPAHLPALWCFCSSTDFHEAVREVDQALKVTNATLGKIPFALAHWEKEAAQKYPHGLPKPFSSDPTQWLFNGHPKGSGQPLQVAVARLLGYQWPRQTGSSFPDCPALSPDGLEKHSEADGIVSLTSLAGKASAADRLRALLAASYGEEWSATKLAELLGGPSRLCTSFCSPCNNRNPECPCRRYSRKWRTNRTRHLDCAKFWPTQETDGHICAQPATCYHHR
jgi:hypothetical protein